MKKALYMLLLLMSGAAFGQVNNYYVSPTGSDSNSGSQAQPWATINHAIDNFTLGASGTVINVAPGTYNTTTGNCSTQTFPAIMSICRGGTATARLVIKCTSQWAVPSSGGCQLRSTTGVYATAKIGRAHV